MVRLRTSAPGAMHWIRTRCPGSGRGVGVLASATILHCRRGYVQTVISDLVPAGGCALSSDGVALYADSGQPVVHAAVNNTKDIVPSGAVSATNAFSLHASLVMFLTVAVLWNRGDVLPVPHAEADASIPSLAPVASRRYCRDWLDSKSVIGWRRDGHFALSLRSAQ